MKKCRKEELTGGTPEENAKITRAILSGEKGPKTDAVILNSAAALYVADPDLTMEEAVKKVKEVIDSGKASEQLENFIRMSKE